MRVSIPSNGSLPTLLASLPLSLPPSRQRSWPAGHTLSDGKARLGANCVYVSIPSNGSPPTQLASLPLSLPPSRQRSWQAGHMLSDFWFRNSELGAFKSQSPRTGHMLSDPICPPPLRVSTMMSQSPRTGHMLSDPINLSISHVPGNPSQSPRTGHMLSDPDAGNDSPLFNLICLNPLERVTCFQTYLVSAKVQDNCDRSQSPRTGHMLSDHKKKRTRRYKHNIVSQSPRTGHMLSDMDEHWVSGTGWMSQSPRTGHMLSDS